MTDFVQIGKKEFDKAKDEIDNKASEVKAEKNRLTPAPIITKSEEDFEKEYRSLRIVVIESKQAYIQEIENQISIIRDGINRIPNSFLLNENRKRAIKNEVASATADENVQLQSICDRAERMFGDMDDYDQSNFLNKLISLFTRGFSWRQDSYRELLLILKDMEIVLSREKANLISSERKISEDAINYAKTQNNEQMKKAEKQKKEAKNAERKAEEKIKEYVEKRINKVFHDIEN